MLIYSMGVSVDGYIADRDGGLGWSVPSDELFAFHLERVRGLGAHLTGRRLYETMLVWETDPTFPDTDDEKEFAEVWTALPKIVFSRSLTTVQGSSRLAESSLPDTITATLASTQKDVEIGGADLAAAAVDLIDEFRIFRAPVVLGGGTPYLPPTDSTVALDLIETRTFPGNIIYERYRRSPGS